MKTTDANRAIESAFVALRLIENENDLNRERLTLAEYNAACEMFSALSTPGTSAKTFLANVAEFYGRHGFTVKPGAINFTISTI